MEELISKLTNEITMMIFLQWLAMFVFTAMAIVCYAVAKYKIQDFYLATILSVIMAFGTVGMTNYYIGRNTGYILKNASESHSIVLYEREKAAKIPANFTGIIFNLCWWLVMSIFFWKAYMGFSKDIQPIAYVFYYITAAVLFILTSGLLLVSTSLGKGYWD